MRTCLDSKSYGASISCLVLQSEVTTGYQLFVSELEGFFVAVAPGTDIQFSSFIHECYEQLEKETD